MTAAHPTDKWHADFPLCEKHPQCIDKNGHDGPCHVPAWADVWSRD